MAVPVWVPGQILTSSDVNTWLVPNGVNKPSDESVTSSTVLQNDNDLVLPVAANASYVMMCYLDYEGGTGNASDLQVKWAVPASATMRYMGIGQNAAGTIIEQLTFTESSVTTWSTNTAGNLRGVLFYGGVTTSSTSGNLQLTWAQNTSSATATIVHAKSVLTLQRTG